MNSYLGVFVVLIYLSMMFCCTGFICDTVFNLKIEKLFQPIYGAVVYFFVLVLIYIPIQFGNKSLKLFSIMVWLLSILIIMFTLFIVRKNIKQLKSENKRCFYMSITRKNFIWDMLFLLFCIFLVFYTINITYYASGYDSSYYHGIINNSVQTGLLNTNDPYTGSVVSYSIFNQIMFYESFVAVISKMFAIHPLIIVNRVIGICEVLAYHYVILLTARKLLGNKKKAVCVTIFVFYINLFMNTIYTSANFLFYRLGESKSITANITLPFIILFICYIYDYIMELSYWLGLYMIIIVGLLVNDTAMILIPASLFALLLPINIKTKEWKVVRNSLICFIPCFIFVALYKL